MKTQIKSPYHEAANIPLDYSALRLLPLTIHVVAKFTATPRWFGLGCRGDDLPGNCSPELSLDRFLRLSQLSVGCQRRRFGHFDCVVTVPECQLQTHDPRTALTRDNVFFEEVAVHTTHPRYVRRRPAAEADGTQDATSYGRRIIRQFKRALRQFAQTKTAERDIVRHFSRLVAQVAGQRHIPATFTTGKALPRGLAETLLDLVVRAPESKVPTLAEIDWNGDWLAARSAAPAQFDNEIVVLLAAFRDALLSTTRRQYCQTYITKTWGLQRLDSLAVKLLAKEAAPERIRRLRSARATAQRIYSNPTLHGLMLKEVVDTLYRQPEVTEADSDQDNLIARDRIVGSLVRGERASDRVAAPVKRLSPAEKRQFRAEMLAGFEDFIHVVIADAATVGPLEERLSPALRELARRTRQSPAKLDLLRQVAGKNPRAFVASARDLISGVLLPVLLRDPTQSVTDWLDCWREAVERLYLTALLLDQNSLDAIRGVGKKEQIVALMDQLVTLKDGDKESIKCELIGHVVAGLVDVYAQPQIQRRLLEGLATLRRVSNLAREVGLPVQGLAHLAAEEAAEPTRVQVRAVVTQNLQRKVAQRMTDLRQAPDGFDAALAGARAARSSHADSGTDSGTESEPSATSAHDGDDDVGREIDEILTGLTVTSGVPVERDYDRLASATVEALEDSVSRQLTAFAQCLHAIYSRYVERPDVATFKSGVELLSLVQLMLEDKEELPFGEADSCLFPLLSGLVEHATDDADLAEFIREVPLTRFFDEEKLSDDGVVNLRLMLEQQGLQSLQMLTATCSELHSLEMIIEQARAAGGRIIVFDATCDEYLEMLRSDAVGSGLFGPGSLVVRDGGPPSCAGGVTVLLGSAFSQTGREEFVGRLQQLERVCDGYPLAIPILVLSSGLGAEAGSEGEVIAESLRTLAEQAAVPVLIVGPDQPLNPPGSPLPSKLDAAAAFVAGLISPATLGLNATRVPVQGVPGCTTGRRLVLGAGTASLWQSIQAGVLPAQPDSQYGFAVDRYLHLIATTAAAGKYHGGESRFNQAAFLDSFHWSGSGMVGRFGESSWLQALLPSFQVALEQRPSQAPVESVLLQSGPVALTDRRASPVRLSHVDWFAKTLQALALVDPAPAEEEVPG